MTSRRAFLSRLGSSGTLAVAALNSNGLSIMAKASEQVRGRSVDEIAGDEDFWREVQLGFTLDRTVINLNNGIVRTSFRDSLSDPTPATPGRPYEYHIAVWPTCYEFQVGDRIRLEVSSSDYPQFAPNPNTGAPFGTDTATQIATQTILHDSEHPSTVTMPVVPG